MPPPDALLHMARQLAVSIRRDKTDPADRAAEMIQIEAASHGWGVPDGLRLAMLRQYREVLTR
jgi:hypothetical protein